MGCLIFLWHSCDIWNFLAASDMFENWDRNVLDSNNMCKTPSNIIGTVYDLRPTFHIACGNLWGAIKQVTEYPFFNLILSFYPLNMTFEVSPFLPIKVHCNTLCRETFGYIGSTKNLFDSLNFLEPLLKVQERTFLNCLKRSKQLKTNHKLTHGGEQKLNLSQNGRSHIAYQISVHICICH